MAGREPDQVSESEGPVRIRLQKSWHMYDKRFGEK